MHDKPFDQNISRIQLFFVIKCLLKVSEDMNSK